MNIREEEKVTAIVRGRKTVFLFEVVRTLDFEERCFGFRLQLLGQLLVKQKPSELRVSRNACRENAFVA